MRSRFLVPLLGAFAALFIASASIPARADDNGLLAVKICGPTTATGAQCAIPNPDGTFSITGSFSATLAGFTPGGTTANLAVTTTSADVALPAGTVVKVVNWGATDVHFRVTVGAGTAVTTDEVLKAGAATGVTVGSNTHLSAITDSSTSTLSLAGGSGLVSGYGGGGSGGGGGAVTSVDGGLVTLGAKADAKSTATDTTAVTAMQVLKQISASVQAPPSQAVTNAGTFAAQLTGATNNINNIAGTVSLPTGAATATNQTNVTGTVAAGTAAANSQLTGCIYNSTEPSPTTGQGLGNQCDSKGRQRQVLMDAAGNTRGANVTAGNALVVDGSASTQPMSAASLPLPTGAATSALQPTNAAQGSTTSGQTGPLVQCSVTTAAPTYTTAQTDPLNCSTAGGLRVLDANSAALLAAAQASIPAGSAIIGKVGIDQTTDGTTNAVHLVAGTAIAGKVGIDQTTLGTTNAVQPIAGTTGGLTMFYLTAANSTNATNVKASAGGLYDADLSNNSATPAYVSFYNNSGTPICGTSIVYQMMIPANSTSGAGWVSHSDLGKAFSTGIAICVTTGIAGTGAVAASAYTISLGYK